MSRGLAALARRAGGPAALALLPVALAGAAGGGGLDALKPGGQHLTHTLPAGSGPLIAVPEARAPALEEGARLFARDWLAGEGARAGPHYDRTRCAGCHVEAAAVPSATRRGPAYRVATAPGPALARRFAGQVNTRSVPPARPEATVRIHYRYRAVRYGDGTLRILSAPVALATTAGGERFRVGLRAAPLLFGWGLLANVDPAMLRHFHDPSDRDGDGLSGRLALREPVGAGRPRPGIFGWKSAMPSLRGQIAKALSRDMGVATAAFPAAGGAIELGERELDALTRFVRHIGVPESPERRSARVQRGGRWFGQAGCSGCHVPVLRTAPARDPAFDRQLIWPYTDLMLHDLGPALATAGGGAEAREWRTAPLWGIGLIEARRPEHGFLHDGRAADIEEAVLWHGGEAAAARAAFLALPRLRREELLAYLRAL